MTILYVDMLPPRYTDQFKNFTKKLPHQARLYFQNMFPIVHWLPKYNWIWFFGDLTAAITVGTLVIPQSLAYGKMKFIKIHLMTKLFFFYS
jgi:sodium-independent sulfate anion transporter 11